MVVRYKSHNNLLCHLSCKPKELTIHRKRSYKVWTSQIVCCSVYRLSLQSFAWLMTGIVYTTPVCLFLFRKSRKTHSFGTSRQYESAAYSVNSSHVMCHPITTLLFYLITPAYVSLSVSLSPTNSLYTQRTTQFVLCCLHDWRRVWKNARFGSEMSGWIWSMKKVGSPVRRRENGKRTSQDSVTSHAGQRSGESGTAEQLAAWELSTS